MGCCFSAPTRLDSSLPILVVEPMPLPVAVCSADPVKCKILHITEDGSNGPRGTVTRKRLLGIARRLGVWADTEQSECLVAYPINGGTMTAVCSTAPSTDEHNTFAYSVLRALGMALEEEALAIVADGGLRHDPIVIFGAEKNNYVLTILQRYAISDAFAECRMQGHAIAAEGYRDSD